jgi:hypothetical protein
VISIYSLENFFAGKLLCYFISQQKFSRKFTLSLYFPRKYRKPTERLSEKKLSIFIKFFSKFLKTNLNTGNGGGRGHCYFYKLFSNARDVVIASQQSYIIGAKGSKYRKGPSFSTTPPCFYFFSWKTFLLSPSFAALIRVLTVVFSFGASK